MGSEQVNLAAAAPDFIAATLTALPSVQSFHVGIVDTDTYPGLGDVDPLDGCPAEADCAACDYQLGGLLTKPGSAVDPGSTCGVSSGQPFLDAASPTFAAEFQCVADVGTAGNPVEQQVGALLAAISPEMNASGQCNAGFIRDDALLVVVLMSDEEDDNAEPPAPQGGSAGEPAAWRQAVLDAKGGSEDRVVTLALIGGSPRFPDCGPLSNNDGAEETPRLQQFFDGFPRSASDSVCAPEFESFFDGALYAVVQACVGLGS